MNPRYFAGYFIFLVVGMFVLLGCRQATTPREPTAAIAAVAPTETVVPTTIATKEATPTNTAVPTATTIETAVSTITPTEEPSPMVRFMLASEPKSSILPVTDSEALTNELTGPGAVTYHDGQFHMFFNAIQGGWPPDDIGIGYMTSVDGINWTLAADEPILVGSQTPFDIHTIYAGSVVVNEDGTWLLYFHTISDSLAQGKGDAIGVAMAPAPTGPWTVHDRILLAPDPQGWDSYALWAPSVVRTEAGYFMYYSGNGPPPQWDRAIGLATSADGLNWTRHGEPVLQASEENDAWDGQRVEQSVVTTSPDGFVMIYRADRGSSNFSSIGSAFGYATSADGVVWQRGQADPVLQPKDESAWHTLWSAGMAYLNETYYLFVETDGPYRGTRIYTTIYEGSLP